MCHVLQILAVINLNSNQGLSTSILIFWKTLCFLSHRIHFGQQRHLMPGRRKVIVSAELNITVVLDLLSPPYTSKLPTIRK